MDSGEEEFMIPKPPQKELPKTTSYSRYSRMWSAGNLIGAMVMLIVKFSKCLLEPDILLPKDIFILITVPLLGLFAAVSAILMCLNSKNWKIQAVISLLFIIGALLVSLADK